MEINYQQGLFLLIGCWIFVHILFSISLVRSPNKKIAIACVVLLIAVYVFKPITADLPKYSSYFTTGYLAVHSYNDWTDGVYLDPRDLTGEPFDQAFRRKIWGNIYSGSGFSYLSKMLHATLPKGNFLPRILSRNWYIADFPIIAIMVLSLTILIIAARNLFSSSGIVQFSKKQLVFTVPVIMGSVFYMIGSQSAIRQCLTISLIFLALSFIRRKRHVSSTIIFVVAASMHNWGLVFALLSVPIVLILEKLKHSARGSSRTFLGLWVATSGLIAGCLVVIGIELLLSPVGNGVVRLVGDFQLVSDLKLYVNLDYSHLLGRTSAFYKLLLIGSLVITSELILGNRKLKGDFDIRSFRLAIFSFSIPLVIYPELFSRFLFFYFAAEMFFVISNIWAAEARARLASAIIFLAYSIAPNAINVLAGTEWRNIFI